MTTPAYLVMIVTYSCKILIILGPVECHGILRNNTQHNDIQPNTEKWCTQQYFL